MQTAVLEWAAGEDTEGCIMQQDSRVGHAMMPAPYGVQGYADAAPAEEKEVLQNQAAFLEKQLEQIRKRLDGLEES